MKSLIILSIFIIFSLSASAEIIDTAWVRTFNSQADNDDDVYDMVVTPNGDVYLAGSAMTDYDEGDGVLIKYSPSGNLEWTRYYSGAENTEVQWTKIVMDGDNNICVVGNLVFNYSDCHLIIAKYSSNGELLWDDVKYNAGSEHDGDITISSDGFIFWVGRNIYKYDSDGNQIWFNRFPDLEPDSGNAYAISIAVNDMGEAFVLGYGKIGQSMGIDLVLSKYSPDGQEQWMIFYDEAMDYSGVWTGLEVVLDGSSNAYIVGTADYGSNQFTAKYNTNGTEQWAFSHEVTGGSSGRGIEIDNSATYVYITGKEGLSSCNQGPLTIRRNCTNGSGEMYQMPEFCIPGVDIKIDNSGYTYVLGSYLHDLYLIKYDNDLRGDILWLESFSGKSSAILSRRLELDVLNNIYSTGRISSDTTGHDMLLIKYHRVPEIIAVTPEHNAVSITEPDEISVVFDTAMTGVTIDSNSFKVYSSNNSFYTGSYSYDESTYTAYFYPDSSFKRGEQVSVQLTTDVESELERPLKTGYTWNFDIGTDLGGIFGNRLDIETNDGPHDIVAADLNGDRNIDLITPNENADNISVFINQGNGIFDPAVDYGVGDLPLRACAADFNADGYIDIASANYQSNSISILLNNGDGTFANQLTFPVGLNPRSITYLDVDGDGSFDIVTANEGENSVKILSNNGLGIFTITDSLPVGSIPYYICAFDLENDGDLDLVTANYGSNDISILEHDGKRGYKPAESYAVLNGPYHVHAADIYGNGYTDLLVSCANANKIVHLRNSYGSFSTYYYDIGLNPQSCFASDIDGDGDKDVIVCSFANDSLFLLQNIGGTLLPIDSLDVNAAPYVAISADFDGDGAMDLVSANRDSDNLTIRFNEVPPYISSISPSPNQQNLSIHENITAIFNKGIDQATLNDSSIYVWGSYSGRIPSNISYSSALNELTIDPLINFYVGETVSVLLTNEIKSTEGDHIYNSMLWQFFCNTLNGEAFYDSLLQYSVNDDALSMTSADVDNDLDIDLIVTNNGDNQISILYNDGNGSFAMMAEFETISNPISIQTGDINNDGFIDIVLGSTNRNQLTLMINNASGAFPSYTKFNSEIEVDLISLNDFDNDGFIDIIAASTNSSALYFYMNNSDSTFSETNDFDFGNNILALNTVDIDADGDIDILLLCEHRLLIITNLGSGIFSQDALIDYSSNSQSFSVVELTNDSLPDIAVATSHLNSIQFFHNLGEGDFEQLSSYQLSFYPIAINAADINGDGYQDLVAISDDDEYIARLLNNGFGIFEDEVSYLINEQPVSLNLFDINNDGDIDIAVGHDSSNDNISVLYNSGEYICVDSDNDGFGDPDNPDNECPDDNCPSNFNPNQEDYDGDLVGDVCDPCSNIPPVLANVGDTIAIAFDSYFEFYPVENDPDDETHTITYIEYPHWCTIQNDSLIGEVPDTTFEESLIAIVEDACNIDTLISYTMIYLCGNGNGDNSVNVSDAVYIINYVFTGGPAPVPYDAGDANGDGKVNVSDAVYIINYVFNHGPAPNCPD